ncbi:hypothetical protein EZV73_18145 [Acidaminobacter sp. JC074]|uniref:DUF6873 family GME fold protein n=1 Tax=Acidaminobacter sp. JC074 TaxID=2530199 RepID=UPI001F10990C|nr:hypothetical protein [Acidaminobacter sp. JC074]MCH4889508.1 hypothetical protein [Acidaminobacter sp. JC074]
MRPKIIISEKAYDEAFDYFIEKGFEIIRFSSQDKPYEAVSHHPDMFLFYDDKLFVEGDCEIEGVRCERLGPKYPETIKYNIAKVGDYVICKYSHISARVKKHIEEKNYKVIDVNQGYAKCSTAIIRDSIITSDQGIFDACKDKLDCLLIEPGHIELPGLDYGFIGGTCLTFDDTVFFHGDITKHPDYEKIRVFIEKKHMRIDYLKRPLMDIGSFIVTERSE